MILNNSYKQEIEISNAMMHEKSFIQNFHYKIAHDQNFSVFFKSLMEKSAEVDSMFAYDFAVFKREVIRIGVRCKFDLSADLSSI